MSQIKAPLVVYLPDTRGVEISRYGYGNLKIGLGIYTYSRRAGGTATCPGATRECEDICYAKRIAGPVLDVYDRNAFSDVPPIPEECSILRIHISGDFDSRAYIKNWIARLKERPDVTCWAYTRSWRVPELLDVLEDLRSLPNMQLFASMDPTCKDMPPDGWRRAWIWRDKIKGIYPCELRLGHHVKIDTGTHDQPHQSVHGVSVIRGNLRNQFNLIDGTPSFVCPEETKHKQNCLECGYCFEGQKHDVTFLEH